MGKITRGKPYPMFEQLCLSEGLPQPEREFQFAPPRKWRFDFSWFAQQVALEVDGGVWTGGRHTRGKGFVADIEKLNEAAVLGWCVLRCTTSDIESCAVFALLRRALNN